MPGVLFACILPWDDSKRGVPPQSLVDDHIQVLHLLDGGVLGHLALVPLVCLIHLIPELVLDLGVGGQDVGNISEGQACRVVPGDEYNEGGGTQRYDIKVFVLFPKRVRSIPSS